MTQELPVSLEPQREKVFAIMTREVTTVRKETTLATAMEALVSQDISHLPVVDDDNRVVGILSKTDVVRQHFMAQETVEGVRLPAKNNVSYSDSGFHEDNEPHTTVADVMSPRTLCVRDNVSISEAARVMVEHTVHGLPVVAEGNKLVGFISTMDITRWLAQGPVR